MALKQLGLPDKCHKTKELIFYWTFDKKIHTQDKTTTTSLYVLKTHRIRYRDMDKRLIFHHFLRD